MSLPRRFYEILRTARRAHSPGRSDALMWRGCWRNRSTEEEGADNLLTQIARELMGKARTGTSKAPKLAGMREE